MTGVLSEIAPGPICLALYSVRKEMGKDLEACLQRIASFGISEVGVRGMGPENAHGFARQLGAAGLTAPQMTLEAAPDIGLQFEAAKILGCQFITIPAAPVYFAADASGRLAWKDRVTSAEFAPFAKQVAGLAAQAKSIDLSLLYHFHDLDFRPMDDGLSPYDWMTTRVPPDALGFHLDIAWLVQGRADLPGLLQRLAGRISVADLKDVRPEEPAERRGQNMYPAGQGVVDFPAAAALFRASGAQLLMLENEPLENEFEGVESALRTLRTLNVIV